MLACGGLLAWQGWVADAEPGVWAAVAATVVCWLSATIALVVSSLLAGTPQAFHGLLASILLRTMVPLAVAVFLQEKVPYLANAGVFGKIVVAYLVALTVESLLATWMVRPNLGPVAKAL